MEIIKINSEEFNNQVFHQEQNVVLIWVLDHCKLSKKLIKYVQKIKNLADTKVCVVDAEENPELAEQYQIIGYPTYFIVHKDTPQPSRFNHHIGFTSEGDFMNNIKKSLHIR